MQRLALASLAVILGSCSSNALHLSPDGAVVSPDTAALPPDVATAVGAVVAPILDAAGPADPVDAPVPAADVPVTPDAVVDAPAASLPDAGIDGISPREFETGGCDGGLCVWPDAWAGVGCPCPGLEALVSKCNMPRCTLGSWRPTGVGVGSQRGAEIRDVNGKVCFDLLWVVGIRGQPPQVTIYDRNDLQTYFTLYGDDFQGQREHDFKCMGDLLIRVPESRCAGLEWPRLCEGAPDGGP